jgi:hypothetical protein
LRDRVLGWMPLDGRQPRYFEGAPRSIMTADQDFDTIFRKTDLLLVVDEWKWPQVDSAPAILQARAFCDTRRSTRALYRLLVEAGAARWHARGKRSESAFLFDSTAFDAVMRELDYADTCNYNHLDRNPRHYLPTGPAAPNWARIMREYPEIGKVWDVDAPHARSLFWFIECLIRCLRVRVAEELNIKIIVDQQDWFSGRRSRLPEFEPGLACLRDLGNALVLGITDKAQAAVARYMPLLGLVDSELWAFGRLLSLKMHEGGTVHQRYMHHASQGPIGEDDVIIPQEAWDDLFETHHGAHDQLKRYWIALSNWSSSKNIDINEALESVVWGDL